VKLLRRIGWVSLAERAAVILGALFIAIAIAAFDWRLGLGVAGFLLLAGGLDTSRRP